MKFQNYISLLEDFQKNNERYYKLFSDFSYMTHKTYGNILKANLTGDIDALKATCDNYKIETEQAFKNLFDLNMNTIEETTSKIQKIVELYKPAEEKNEEPFPYLKERLKVSPFSYAARMAGLLGAFNISKATVPVPYENDTSPTTRNLPNLHHPAPISFAERVKLKSKLATIGNTLSTLEREKKASELRVEEQELLFKETLKKTNYDARYQDLISDPSCFMNQVTSEQAKLYGNLSALVYQIDQEKKIGKADTKLTKLDRQITILNQQITLLESWQETLIGALKTTPDTSPVMETVRKNIKNVFNFSIHNDSTLEEILSFMVDKTQDLQTKISRFEVQRDQENSAYFAEAKKVFGHNLFGSNYEVQGIFHRNNGEFSGLAAYDQEKDELVLSFAGSKSSRDWIKNIFGWNSKMSAKHGLLTNISFHSGFGSHLDDNADSFFSFMHSWMRNYQQKGISGKLKIVGTGHSLGGALAEIFTAATKQLADKHKISANVGVMTFGSPSTVNANCLETYTNILGGDGNIIRFAHSYDLVPKLVFWKTSPGAIKIERDTSLFSDVNGTLVLPIRVNPHSSDEYYHAAETVFKQWKNDFSTLQRQVSILNSLKEEERTKLKEIQEASKEAHRLLVTLANQDATSAAIFEDEYISYQKKIEEEFEALKVELKNLLEKMALFETKSFSKQEKALLTKQASALKEKIKKKKEMLAELARDKAWKPYIALMDQEFENLQASLLKLQ